MAQQHQMNIIIYKNARTMVFIFITDTYASHIIHKSGGIWHRNIKRISLYTRDVNHNQQYSECLVCPLRLQTSIHVFQIGKR